MLTKKKITGLIIILLVVIIGGALIFSRGDKAPTYETGIVKLGTLIQKVSVTGSVKPAEEVALAFEKSGKVVSLPFKVGDKVKSGQIVASLASADVYAQLLQASASLDGAKATLLQYEAALDTQKAKLNEYLKGTKPEEIQVAETAVSNAAKELVNAKTNLTNVQNKAAADLNEDYNNALTALSSSITVAETALFSMTDIQMANFNGTDADSIIVQDRKATAVFDLLGALNAGRYDKGALIGLKGGAKGAVLAAEVAPSQVNIDTAIFKTKSAMQSIKNAFSAIPITMTMSTTTVTTINTQKGYVDTEISTLTTKEQSIAVQKLTNQSAITTAEASVTTAENTLKTAQDNLAVKKSGYTAEQIAAQSAQVKQAESTVAAQSAQVKYAQANVANYHAQAEKNSLRSPLNGIITKINAKLGEIATANAEIVNIISEAKYQIEANVAEVDVADIKIGDAAIVTLDAYSTDKEFSASVIKIDPAETIIDNVPTYKVTFEFSEENAAIKPGMTADLDITTATKENVLIVPQRAVLKKNGLPAQAGDKIVRVLENDVLTEKKVLTGLRGENGEIEIVSGLNEGETVVLSIKTAK